METVNIKGKEYVTVVERLKVFRLRHPGFSLRSEIVRLDDKVCVIKAIISNPAGFIVAEGIAYEVEGNSFINKTSYIENCETSAWGRALGNFGIGLDSHVRSFEEMSNATLNQTTPEEANREASKKKLLESGKELITEEQENQLIKLMGEFSKIKKSKESNWIDGQINSGMLTKDRASDIIASAEIKLEEYYAAMDDK